MFAICTAFVLTFSIYICVLRIWQFFIIAFVLTFSIFMRVFVLTFSMFFFIIVFVLAFVFIFTMSPFSSPISEFQLITRVWPVARPYNSTM